jgi:hypothetical protein
MALARAAATSQLRTIDLSDPRTWEFVGFSQNGEDGIIDVLMSRLLRPNRYFIEIGSDTGVENNTAWLAIARKYSGLMVEGNLASSRRARLTLTPINPCVEHVCMFVSAGSADALLKRALHKDPDLFSLDIDGVDYHVARAVLDAGLRPKVVIVEYNSAFGPERALTIPDLKDFRKEEAHPSHLYYGASVAAFRKLFESHAYRFLTVDQNGVNAFFVDEAEFDPAFIRDAQGPAFLENVYQRKGARTGWEGQFAQIKDMSFNEV